MLYYRRETFRKRKAKITSSAWPRRRKSCWTTAWAACWTSRTSRGWSEM